MDLNKFLKLLSLRDNLKENFKSFSKVLNNFWRILSINYRRGTPMYTSQLIARFNVFFGIILICSIVLCIIFKTFIFLILNTGVYATFSFYTSDFKLKRELNLIKSNKCALYIFYIYRISTSLSTILFIFGAYMYLT